jgi:hypothetical protein
MHLAGLAPEMPTACSANWKQFEILRGQFRDQFRVSGNFADLVNHRAIFVC